MYKKNIIFSTYNNIIEILLQCPQVMKIQKPHTYNIQICPYITSSKSGPPNIFVLPYITHPARSSTKRIIVVLCLVIHHTSSKVKHQKNQTLLLCVFDSQVCALNLISRTKKSKPKGMTYQRQSSSISRIIFQKLKSKASLEHFLENRTM